VNKPVESAADQSESTNGDDLTRALTRVDLPLQSRAIARGLKAGRGVVLK
jgi:hypothetical protein